MPLTLERDETSMARGPVPPADLDGARYLRAHRDVAKLGADPLEHWLAVGRDQERAGTRVNWRYPRFQTAYYLHANPDVLGLIVDGTVDSAADHWFRFGRAEHASGARPFGQDFDEAAYLARRGDVAAAIRRGGYVSGLDHWMCWGKAEEDEAPEPIIRIPRQRPSTDALSEEKQAFWKENGFVVLEGAIPPDRCDAAARRIDEFWRTRRDGHHPFCADIFLERPDYRRVPLAQVPDDARALPYKINDVFIADPFFTDLALDEAVTRVLRWVLEAPPCVVASLLMERGSTQAFHTDTLYMPGARPGAMTAAWYALEDVSDDAGPLNYYPGSHHIPTYRFSTGSTAWVADEDHLYQRHMYDHVDRLALAPQRFLPRKGDVLIWHELLFHGGAPIRDPGLTRKSFVCHYWNADLMPAEQLVAWNGAYRQDRPYLG